MADHEFELIRRPVRLLRLTVLPPDGRIRVTAPRFVSEAEVRRLVESKRAWIEKQRLKLVLPVRFLGWTEGSVVAWLGEPLALRLVAGRATTSAAGELFTPLGTPQVVEKRVYAWYRAQLPPVVERLLAEWQPRVGAAAASWTLRRMRTCWGNCRPRTGRVCLNLELAAQPLPLVEYVVVHELVHLLEPSHNARFRSLMTGLMPDWKDRQARLHARTPFAAYVDA